MNGRINFGAPVHALLIGGMCMLLTACSSPPAAAPGQSFDAFINQAPGDEQPPAVAAKDGAYRERRIDKMPWRFLDIQGYYFSFHESFEGWCKAQKLQYVGGDTVKSTGTAACYDKRTDRFVGAYSVDLVKTATAGDRMTAGYAKLSFYDHQRWMAIATAQEMQAENKQLADIERRQCIDRAVKSFRDHLSPGDKSNRGLVVEVKPPLAYVQISGRGQEWVRVDELRPDGDSPALSACK